MKSVKLRPVSRYCCVDCKYYPGEGEICPMTKRKVSRHSKCISTHWEMTVVEQPYKIVDSDSIVVITDHKIIVFEPVFPFQRKEEK